jgi:hypothetical protein
MGTQVVAKPDEATLLDATILHDVDIVTCSPRLKPGAFSGYARPSGPR